jgi:hypothetical protein
MQDHNERKRWLIVSLASLCKSTTIETSTLKSSDGDVSSSHFDDGWDYPWRRPSRLSVQRIPGPTRAQEPTKYVRHQSRFRRALFLAPPRLRILLNQRTIDFSASHTAADTPTHNLEIYRVKQLLTNGCSMLQSDLAYLCISISQLSN